MPEQPLFDGNLSFRGGQNSGILPDRIRDDQYASGINLTTKDGGLGPRPGFVHQEIRVTTEGGIETPNGFINSYANIFKTGKFQGAASYVSDSGRNIIATISGIIFRIDPIKCTATVITTEDQESVRTAVSESIEPETQRLDQYCRRHNWSQAGRFFTIFDFPDFPIILDGAEATRSSLDFTDELGNPCPQIPNGVIGAFNQNRLFVGSAVHEFTGGDPVGSLAAPDAPITFKEIFITAAPFLGQVFSLGTTNINNPITAMGFLQAADTSTGFGPLFVATKDSIYTYQTGAPRATWEQIQFGKLVLFNAGIVGPRAVTNINSDMFFMSGDGRIRSLSVSRNAQGKWANTPIDREVRNWVKFDDPDLASLTVVASINNRVYITVDPFRIKALDLCANPVTDYAFGGMVVLELDNVSGLLQDASPAWSGLWTGLYPMELIEFEGDLFIFSKDPGGINRLYKMDETITFDVFEGVPKQVTSRVYTKQYVFQDKFMLKEEVTVEPTLTNLEGDVCVRIDRKTESAPNWSKWRTWKHSAVTENCGGECKEEMDNLLPHNFRELTFGDPEEVTCTTATNIDHRYFRKSQYRITINAKNWKLEDFRAKAEVQPEAERIQDNLCIANEQTKVVKDCSDVSDWLIHRTPLDIPREEACQ